MADKDKSITELIEGMKKSADEIIGEGEKLVEKLKYSEDPRYEEERRRNQYASTRKTTDGRTKNLDTGIVTPAQSYEHAEDFPNNVDDENLL